MVSTNSIPAAIVIENPMPVTTGSEDDPANALLAPPPPGRKKKNKENKKKPLGEASTYALHVMTAETSVKLGEQARGGEADEETESDSGTTNRPSTGTAHSSASAASSSSSDPSASSSPVPSDLTQLAALISTPTPGTVDSSHRMSSSVLRGLYEKAVRGLVLWKKGLHSLNNQEVYTHLVTANEWELHRIVDKGLACSAEEHEQWLEVADQRKQLVQKEMEERERMMLGPPTFGPAHPNAHPHLHHHFPAHLYMQQSMQTTSMATNMPMQPTAATCSSSIEAATAASPSPTPAQAAPVSAPPSSQVSAAQEQ
jgi:hypothetical protein